jgi:hypothetical protein
VFDVAQIDGSVHFDDGFSADGEVRFLDATIKGSLHFRDARFENPGKDALSFHRTRVDGEVFIGRSLATGVDFVAKGTVRFPGAKIGGNLRCHNAVFEGSNGIALDFNGSHIAGNVVLGRPDGMPGGTVGFSARGMVRLVGAKIGGELRCDEAAFASADDRGIALLFDGAEIGGDVTFGKSDDLGAAPPELSAAGAVKLDEEKIDGDVHVERGFSANGEVRFRGTTVKGSLYICNAEFENSSGDALSFSYAWVDGEVFIGTPGAGDRGFLARGAVRFPGANIGGSLRCRNASFEKRGDVALDFNGAKVGGNVILGTPDSVSKEAGRFSAKGTVRLVGAKIGGRLDCNCATFVRPGEKALLFDGTEIAGDVIFGTRSGASGFSSTGAVQLVGAKIGGRLSANNSMFEQSNGSALNCGEVTIGLGMHLQECEFNHGDVRITAANIAGDLSIEDSSFNGRVFDIPGQPIIAIRLTRAEIGGRFFLRVRRLAGEIRLAHCHAVVLADDELFAERLEDGGAKIRLDGFVYDRLFHDAPFKAEYRKRWLRLQPDEHLRADFRPQPWEHLIKVLREMGRYEEAREIAIEKRHLLRRAQKIGGPAVDPNGPNHPKIGFHECLPFAARRIRRAWRRAGGVAARRLNWAYGLTTEFGFNSLRLMWIAVFVWFSCGLFYEWAANRAYFVPSNPLIFQNPKYAQCAPIPNPKRPNDPMRGGNWMWCDALSGDYAAFSPFGYSLDLVLPVVSLGQARNWESITVPATVHGPSDTIPRFWHNLLKDARQTFYPWNWLWPLVIRFITWMEVLFGWGASLLFVAALSGLTKRDDAG